MARYSPMETEIIRRLARHLLDAGVPVRRLRVFGSRARGRSSARSDLDIAVDLAAPPDRLLGRHVTEAGRGLSMLNDSGDYGIRVQAVPFFEGEDDNYLSRVIGNEAETVWTRT